MSKSGSWINNHLFTYTPYSLPGYVVMSDSDTINTFKNTLDAHMETEIFYFIIVQPTLEPEIRD